MGPDQDIQSYGDFWLDPDPHTTIVNSKHCLWLDHSRRKYDTLAMYTGSMEGRGDLCLSVGVHGGTVLPYYLAVKGVKLTRQDFLSTLKRDLCTVR
jgi:hypothetical protein